MTQVIKFLLSVVLALAVNMSVLAAPDEWESDFGDAIAFLTGQDDEQFLVTLSFEFPFNGTNYTSVWVGINGDIQLGGLGNDGEIDYDHWSNMVEFVSDGSPSIAGFNSDLDLSGTGTIHFNDFGDYAVFTWNEVGTHENENALLSFQVQLFDNGKIIISYNGVFDGPSEDLVNDLDEGIVVGISAGQERGGTEQGTTDLSGAFTASGTEIYERWCFDVENSCGFNDNNDGLSGPINTAFDLDQRSIIYNPRPNGGFSVNEDVSFVVGGTLTGISVGNAVILQNNGTDNLTLNANGAFNFSSSMSDGETYAVTVANQPTLPNQSCSVSNGTGTLNGDNIDNVNISCTTDAYTIGGSITGLATGNSVVLQNNVSDTLSLEMNGAFSFSTALADGSAYSVTVATQPTAPDQTCLVTNGSGTLTGGSISGVTISCTTVTSPTYTIGGNVNGLAEGNNVVLSNNSDVVNVTTNGVFSFPTALADGSAYSVTVATQPTSPDQTCHVTNGFGTLIGGNVSGVTISCTTDTSPTYTIGGNVTGLADGNNVVLSNNSDVVNVHTNGTFTLPTALVDGSNYIVVVSTQPTSPDQTCNVSNGNGAISGTNIADVMVSCIASGPVIPSAARPIPTLGEWTRILLALILTLAVWVQTRHRREMVD